METLTARQAQVLQIIRDHLSEKGMPPTRAEISEILGFRSANAAEEHVKALVRKGVIVVTAGASRGIRLVEEIEPGLPLIGRVAAGSPILAQEHVERHYQIDPDMFKPSADYLLRVRGMSMRDVGIRDGDLLAVHRTQRARNKQIVVARLGDEVTVKRYEKVGNTVFLHPENADFSVLEIDLKTEPLEIEGIAVGVIRNKFA